MSEKLDLKVGDRVRLTIEGDVTSVPPNRSWLELEGRSYAWSEGTVEIIQKPLSVGDEVTMENAASLPARGFALLDKDGDIWSDEPGVSDLHRYGPFKLVYLTESE